MKAEDFVKSKYPKAVVKHYKYSDPFDKKGYYLCWTEGFNGTRLSEGKTKSNAWVNAKKNILQEMI